MANQLDELNAEIREEGLDTAVIAKKLPAEVGFGSKLFEIALWLCAILPGLIFLFMKINAQKHFDQLQQKIQRNASQIDNFLEQRVLVLQNCARLLDRAIDLDKTTFENIAKYRSGAGADDAARNEVNGKIETISRDINVAVENYPDLAAHQEIRSTSSARSLPRANFTTTASTSGTATFLRGRPRRSSPPRTDIPRASPSSPPKRSKSRQRACSFKTREKKPDRFGRAFLFYLTEIPRGGGALFR